MIAKGTGFWYRNCPVDSHADLVSVQHNGENADAVKENLLMSCLQHPYVNVEECLAGAVQVCHIRRLEIVGSPFGFHENKRKASTDTAIRTHATADLLGNW